MTSLKILIMTFLRVYSAVFAVFVSSEFLCLIRIPSKHCLKVFPLRILVSLERKILARCLSWASNSLSYNSEALWWISAFIQHASLP